MGGWNPVADVVKAVENVTKEVSKGVENVVRETGNAVSTAGQVVSNVGNIVGGDVGKGINALTNPFGGQLQAAGDLVKGDIKGAVTRSVGSQFAGATSPIAASTTIRDIADHDTVNTLTLGFSRDSVKASDAARNMIRTGEGSAEDWSAVGRFGARSALFGAAAIGATAATGSGAAGAASGAAGAGTGGSIGSTIAAGAGAVGTQVIKGEITRALAGQNAGTPSTTATATPSTQASAGFLPLLLMGGFGLLAIIFLKRR